MRNPPSWIVKYGPPSLYFQPDKSPPSLCISNCFFFVLIIILMETNFKLRNLNWTLYDTRTYCWNPKGTYTPSGCVVLIYEILLGSHPRWQSSSRWVADHDDNARPDGTLLWCKWVMIKIWQGILLFFNRLSLHDLFNIQVEIWTNLLYVVIRIGFSTELWN